MLGAPGKSPPSPCDCSRPHLESGLGALCCGLNESRRVVPGAGGRHRRTTAPSALREGPCAQGGAWVVPGHTGRVGRPARRAWGTPRNHAGSERTGERPCTPQKPGVGGVTGKAEGCDLFKMHVMIIKITCTSHSNGFTDQHLPERPSLPSCVRWKHYQGGARTWALSSPPQPDPGRQAGLLSMS